MLSIRRASSAIGDLLWSDEFATPSLNTDFWNIRTGAGGWGNFELQEYTADALNLQDNALEIRVTRTGDATFSSGRIDTAQTVEFLYGRVEARIQTPNVVEGLWPAFWTLGSSFSDGTPWPACGEVDIMEVGQGLALAEGLGNNRVVSAAHWEFREAYATYAGKRDVGFNLNDGYSTFVLDWTPQALITYVNGAEVWRMDINSTKCEDCEEFHQPHFIVLNVAVGGGFTSSSESSSSASSSSSVGCSSSSSAKSGDDCSTIRTPDNITAPLPGAMLVDWVRIFDNGFASLTSGSSSDIITQAPATSPTGTPQPTQYPTPAYQADGLPPPVTLTSSTRHPTSANPLLPPPPTRVPPTRSPVVYSYNVPTSSGSIATSYPSSRIVADATYDDDDGCESGKGKSGKGKSGKGKSGKGKGHKENSERRLKKGYSCGKGKGESKNDVSSDEFETGLFVSSAASHSLVAAVLFVMLAVQ